MTDRDYVARRMDRSLDTAFDIAEAKAEDRGVMLPAAIIGQMALEMYRTRMAMAFSDPDAYDVPDDVRRESY